LDNFDSHDSVLPLFRRSRHNHAPEQFASAVVAEFFGEMYLLTAAHVTDELYRDTEVLVPVIGGQLLPLVGEFRHIDIAPDQLRSEDTLDVAYIRLAPHMVAEVRGAWIPVPQRGIESLPFEHWLDGKSRVCSATGYPVSKARRTDGAHQIDIRSYGGMLITDVETYDRLGYSAALNILLRYDRTKALYFEPGGPVVRSAPNLRGVSGGGIFLWPEITGPAVPVLGRKLIGIMHSYLPRENLIVGSNLLALTTMIFTRHTVS
jgi:hypothetical protein